MQVGACGWNAAVTALTSSQVATTSVSSESSNIASQLYVAVSVREFPIVVTSPLVGAVGSGQTAIIINLTE